MRGGIYTAAIEKIIKIWSEIVTHNFDILFDTVASDGHVMYNASRAITITTKAVIFFIIMHHI